MSGAMTLPNLVTASRLLAVPLIWYGLSTGERTGLWLALGAAIYAELTDLLDGWLARRLNQTSAFGAMFDPLADSLYRFGAFAALAAGGWIPVWALIIFAWRDVIVAYARIQLQAAGKSVGARLSGKLKAIVQGAALLLTIAAGLALEAFDGLISPWLEPVALSVFWAACAVTAWSAFDYAFAAIRASRARPSP